MFPVDSVLKVTSLPVTVYAVSQERLLIAPSPSYLIQMLSNEWAPELKTQVDYPILSLEAYLDGAPSLYVPPIPNTRSSSNPSILAMSNSLNETLDNEIDGFINVQNENSPTVLINHIWKERQKRHSVLRDDAIIDGSQHNLGGSATLSSTLSSELPDFVPAQRTNSNGIWDDPPSNVDPLPLVSPHSERPGQGSTEAHHVHCIVAGRWAGACLDIESAQSLGCDHTRADDRKHFISQLGPVRDVLCPFQVAALHAQRMGSHGGPASAELLWGRSIAPPFALPPPVRSKHSETTDNNDDDEDEDEDEENCAANSGTSGANTNDTDADGSQPLRLSRWERAEAMWLARNPAVATVSFTNAAMMLPLDQPISLYVPARGNRPSLSFRAWHNHFFLSAALWRTAGEYTPSLIPTALGDGWLLPPAMPPSLASIFLPPPPTVSLSFTAAPLVAALTSVVYAAGPCPLAHPSSRLPFLPHVAPLLDPVSTPDQDLLALANATFPIPINSNPDLMSILARVHAPYPLPDATAVHTRLMSTIGPLADCPVYTEASEPMLPSAIAPDPRDLGDVLAAMATMVSLHDTLMSSSAPALVSAPPSATCPIPTPDLAALDGISTLPLAAAVALTALRHRLTRPITRWTLSTLLLAAEVAITPSHLLVIDSLYRCLAQVDHRAVSGGGMCAGRCLSPAPQPGVTPYRAVSCSACVVRACDTLVLALVSRVELVVLALAALLTAVRLRLDVFRMPNAPTPTLVLLSQLSNIVASTAHALRDCVALLELYSRVALLRLDALTHAVNTLQKTSDECPLPLHALAQLVHVNVMWDRLQQLMGAMTGDSALCAGLLRQFYPNTPEHKAAETSLARAFYLFEDEGQTVLVRILSMQSGLHAAMSVALRHAHAKQAGALALALLGSDPDEGRSGAAAQHFFHAVVEPWLPAPVQHPEMHPYTPSPQSPSPPPAAGSTTSSPRENEKLSSREPEGRVYGEVLGRVVETRDSLDWELPRECRAFAAATTQALHALRIASAVHALKMLPAHASLRLSMEAQACPSRRVLSATVANLLTDLAVAATSAATLHASAHLHAQQALQTYRALVNPAVAAEVPLDPTASLRVACAPNAVLVPAVSSNMPHLPLATAPTLATTDLQRIVEYHSLMQTHATHPPSTPVPFTSVPMPPLCLLRVLACPPPPLWYVHFQSAQLHLAAALFAPARTQSYFHLAVLCSSLRVDAGAGVTAVLPLQETLAITVPHDGAVDQTSPSALLSSPAPVSLDCATAPLMVPSQLSLYAGSAGAVLNLSDTSFVLSSPTTGHSVHLHSTLACACESTESALLTLTGVPADVASTVSVGLDRLVARAPYNSDAISVLRYLLALRSLTAQPYQDCMPIWPEASFVIQADTHRPRTLDLRVRDLYSPDEHARCVSVLEYQDVGQWRHEERALLPLRGLAIPLPTDVDRCTTAPNDLAAALTPVPSAAIVLAAAAIRGFALTTLAPVRVRENVWGQLEVLLCAHGNSEACMCASVGADPLSSTGGSPDDAPEMVRGMPVCYGTDMQPIWLEQRWLGYNAVSLGHRVVSLAQASRLVNEELRTRSGQHKLPARDTPALLWPLVRWLSATHVRDLFTRAAIASTNKQQLVGSLPPAFLTSAHRAGDAVRMYAYAGALDDAGALCNLGALVKTFSTQAHSSALTHMSTTFSSLASSTRDSPPMVVTLSAWALLEALSCHTTHGDGMGRLLSQEELLQLSMSLYARALVVCPAMSTARLNMAIALTDLGTLFKERGEQQEALSLYAQALQHEPGYYSAWYNIGVLLVERGDIPGAMNAYKTAIAHNPQCAEAHNNLGVLYKDMGDNATAILHYRAALTVQPTFTQTLNNLSVAHAAVGDIDSALDTCEEAIRLDPNYAQAYNNRGVLYRDQGCLQECLFDYARCIQLDPANRAAAQNRLLALNSVPGAVHLCARAHLRWGARIDAACTPFTSYRTPPLHKRKQGSGPRRTRFDRPLRVGFISADLFTHSVSYFFLSVLLQHATQKGFAGVASLLSTPEGVTPTLPFDRTAEALHSQSIETYVYAVGQCVDGQTTRLRSLATMWRECAVLTPQALADRIHDDGVDVLIELGGHTAGNRLDVMALKPAPVTVTWLGYPNTTGLRSIMYRCTDFLCDPIQSQQPYSERLVRMPGPFICYTPSPHAPPVSAMPALLNLALHPVMIPTPLIQPTEGAPAVLFPPLALPQSPQYTFTFGCFNSLAKLTDRTVFIWSIILANAPHARLLIKSKPFKSTRVQAAFRARFARHGISPDRLILLPLTAHTQSHLETYSQVDMALDVCPYAGTTTTCECTWMGVPTVTLANTTPTHTHAHNVGKSILMRILPVKVDNQASVPALCTCAPIAQPSDRVDALLHTQGATMLPHDTLDRLVADDADSSPIAEALPLQRAAPQDLPATYPLNYDCLRNRYLWLTSCETSLIDAIDRTYIAPSTYDTTLAPTGTLPENPWNGSTQVNSFDGPAVAPHPPPMRPPPAVALTHVSPGVAFVAHSEWEYVKKAVFWAWQPLLLARVRQSLRAAMWGSDICNHNRFCEQFNETLSQMALWAAEGKNHRDFQLDYSRMEY